MIHARYRGNVIMGELHRTEKIAIDFNLETT